MKELGSEYLLVAGAECALKVDYLICWPLEKELVSASWLQFEGKTSAWRLRLYS
jgi:hypothetical protein